MHLRIHEPLPIIVLGLGGGAVGGLRRLYIQHRQSQGIRMGEVLRDAGIGAGIGALLGALLALEVGGRESLYAKLKPGGGPPDPSSPTDPKGPDKPPTSKPPKGSRKPPDDPPPPPPSPPATGSAAIELTASGLTLREPPLPLPLPPIPSTVPGRGASLPYHQPQFTATDAEQLFGPFRGQSRREQQKALGKILAGYVGPWNHEGYGGPTLRKKLEFLGKLFWGTVLGPAPNS